MSIPLIAAGSMRILLFLAFTLVTVPAAAQSVAPSMAGGAAPSDLLARMQPLPATVLSLRVDPSSRYDKSDDPCLRLDLEIGGKRHFTLIGGEGYLRKHGFTFAKGDDITIHGVPMPTPAGMMVVATKIMKGDKTLPLYDNEGRALWETKP